MRYTWVQWTGFEWTPPDRVRKIQIGRRSIWHPTMLASIMGWAVHLTRRRASAREKNFAPASPPLPPPPPFQEAARKLRSWPATGHRLPEGGRGEGGGGGGG